MKDVVSKSYVKLIDVFRYLTGFITMARDVNRRNKLTKMSDEIKSWLKVS